MTNNQKAKFYEGFIIKMMININSIHRQLISKEIGIRYHRDTKYWNFIPVSSSILIIIIEYIYDTLEKKYESNFLDIGCGTGSIPTIMKYCFNFIKSDGIELREEYIKIAYKYGLLHFSNQLFNSDIFAFEDYDKYDLLYSYNPIKNKNLMDKALIHIISKMKPGAELIFVNECCSTEILNNLGFKKIKYSIFSFKKTEIV